MTVFCKYNAVRMFVFINIRYRKNLVILGCEYLLSRPANFLSKEIMGPVLTCHSKILVCHWLFLARAALERIKKQNF